ncbi:hypothetical protein DN069_17390 [Streptacidiphilus pinicola]|uniref:Putative zinc-finger domain-containing protein n=1 Tax=Streptacidiphilus pinicola TaxID=2219663 RepID=A0A2X0K9X4_9ACTN|nr:zf-HC2 domain-containing protein [Streptacidiphilus pinicola]RAG84269.1 hypothetical protein DN069_17390 [Streptacidiphilus pinicola]
MACSENDSLSAYLLGSLDPAEHAAVERHVAGCPRCQEQLLQLAPLVGLLRHTPFEEFSVAPALAWQPTKDTPPHGRTAADGGSHFALSWGRRNRLGRLLAGIAATAAALGAGLGIYFGAFASGPARPAFTLSATSPVTGISASATLTPDQSGTALQLKVTGLPPAITCRLVVHAQDGRSETAATWASGYSTAVSVPASTSISPQDISRMDVLDASGRLLVELPQT